MMRSAWVLICLVTLARTVSAAPPPPPPPNPEIVFVDGSKIVVMNSDGSNTTTVYTAASGDMVFEPVLSPDAGWVAFRSNANGLVQVDRITKAATVLLTNAQCGSGCFNPRFSPSGSRIAVIDGSTSAPRVLAVPSPAGGAAQVLYSGTSGVPFFDVAWDTDETQIAVVELLEASPNRIIVVNLATGTPRTIVEGFDLFVIDWARNGIDRIIFDAEIGGSADRNIYTVDFTDTGASPPVLVTGGKHPSYSPDNGSIVYRKNGPGGQAKLAKRVVSTGATTSLGNGNMPEWKR